MTLKVKILGCGWLGLPLAKKLIEQNIKVIGTITSSQKLHVLTSAGIIPEIYKAENGSPKIGADINAIVISIPPKTKSTDGNWYLSAMEDIIKEINLSMADKLIFISSTSVYPEWPEIMDENIEISDENAGNNTILKAEKIASNCKSKVYILRMGGLAGNDRLLARHFAGRKNIYNSNYPVNLIHQSDAVAILNHFLLNDFKTGTYNVCAPMHPTKQDLYTRDCKKFNLEAPEFAEDNSRGKIISVEKLINETNYNFVFPDPFEFTYTQNLLQKDN